jgi:hypothetical protein
MSEEHETTTRTERVDHQLPQTGWIRSSRRVIDELFLASDTALRE